MKNEEIVRALRRLKVETGSLVCMGCGREHDCGILGCRIVREAAELIEKLTDRCARYAVEIAVTQERTRWIPVTERRPEQDAKYLCVYSFRTIDDSPARMSFPSVLDYYATDSVPHFQHEE